MTGKEIKLLTKNGSAEGQPIGFDDVATYPRNYNWRDDEPATITYVQALDKGLGRSKAAYRDALYALQIGGNTGKKNSLKQRAGLAVLSGVQKT
jgi:hypothetical protein